VNRRKRNDLLNNLLKTTDDNLRQIISRLNSLREEEQITLARRIHDNLSQTLTALQLEISIIGSGTSMTGAAAEHFSHVKELTVTLMDTTKELINGLRPPLLDDFGIVAGLEWLVSRYQTDSGFVCTVLAEPKEISLSFDYRTALYRIAEEALENAARHASARTVALSLIGSSKNIRLVISDDGVGFNPRLKTEAAAGKFGLLQMHERVYFLGGEISIDSSPDIGTSIVVQIPLVSEESE